MATSCRIPRPGESVLWRLALATNLAQVPVVRAPNIRLRDTE
jgi:hypothetical protein